MTFGSIQRENIYPLETCGLVTLEAMHVLTVFLISCYSLYFRSILKLQYNFLKK